MVSSQVGDFIALFLLFLSFLFVPQITASLKASLDTLPMRLAAVILILGAVSYDRYLALGTFLVISAIYIQHHHEDILEILGTSNNMGLVGSAASQKYNSTIQRLEHGGHADESYDTGDFTSKAEDQDNEFKPVDSSIDEKHALNSETLGSRSQTLFPDDSKHVNAMEHGNKNGYSE
uniref:Uncharacterized protein n=1 Tax=viral metagenome TaxID=1070528 RepID=A0A6C0AP95_9ZZZZ